MRRDDLTSPGPGPTPGPGWYPDRRGAVRWWDGGSWTDRTRDDGAAEEPGGGAPSRRLRLLVGGAVALVLFCAVAAATVLLLGLVGPTASGDGPADVVEANFAALRDGDCAAYVATFSAADRKVMGDAFCQQSAVFGDDRLGRLVVGSTDVDGDAARVVGTFTDSRGAQAFAFDLVREDGGWMIVQ